MPSIRPRESFCKGKCCPRRQFSFRFKRPKESQWTTNETRKKKEEQNKTHRLLFFSAHEPQRIFKLLLQRLQKGGTNGSISHAMVGRKRQRHDLRFVEGTFLLARLHHSLGRSHGQDSGLRRIDHRRKRLDAESTQVANCKRSALHLGQPELLFAGLARKLSHITPAR